MTPHRQTHDEKIRGQVFAPTQGAAGAPLHSLVVDRDPIGTQQAAGRASDHSGEMERSAVSTSGAENHAYAAASGDVVKWSAVVHSSDSNGSRSSQPHFFSSLMGSAQTRVAGHTTSGPAGERGPHDAGDNNTMLEIASAVDLENGNGLSSSEGTPHLSHRRHSGGDSPRACSSLCSRLSTSSLREASSSESSDAADRRGSSRRSSSSSHYTESEQPGRGTVVLERRTTVFYEDVASSVFSEDAQNVREGRETGEEEDENLALLVARSRDSDRRDTHNRRCSRRAGDRISVRKNRSSKRNTESCCRRFCSRLVLSFMGFLFWFVLLTGLAVAALWQFGLEDVDKLLEQRPAAKFPYCMRWLAAKAAIDVQTVHERARERAESADALAASEAANLRYQQALDRARTAGSHLAEEERNAFQMQVEDVRSAERRASDARMAAERAAGSGREASIQAQLAVAETKRIQLADELFAAQNEMSEWSADSSEWRDLGKEVDEFLRTYRSRYRKKQRESMRRHA